jgi:hypothetical protein
MGAAKAAPMLVLPAALSSVLLPALRWGALPACSAA